MERALQLEAIGISVAWGGVRALEDVDFAVSRGEIVGLIGPNGAGKTTLVNVLSGFQEPESGRIELGGTDITDAGPVRRARNGLVRSFQDARLFNGLSVAENVVAASLGTGRSMAAAEGAAIEILTTFGLLAKTAWPCEQLTYGEQRRLAIARAVASEPAVLLLDEPAAGLNDHETAELGAEISQLPERADCGVVLVEHDMSLVTSVCHRVHVLADGRTIFTGGPAEAMRDSAVVEAYLGSGAEQLEVSVEAVEG